MQAALQNSLIHVDAKQPAGSHGFHRIVARWFAARFPGGPTLAQQNGWPAIGRGEDTLIAAPTGSGKTLTAFLVCIDKLLREAKHLHDRGDCLKDTTRVLYVSPLKALASDIRKNLELPLAEIQASAEKEGFKLPSIRALVRTGDTPAHQRAAMLKRPPHIMVTTPESLYLLLTSEKSRAILRTVDTVIVDEIHAIARDKRGAHLALSLARLDALCLAVSPDAKRPQRIGLSATQKPIAQIAHFLVGQLPSVATPAPCTIIDTGHRRELDLAVEVPGTELGAVCSHEQWEEVYTRIAELVKTHQSTLIFVNTRKLAERVAFHLTQILGDEAVASHHGSLSKDRRLAAEERLKAGTLKVIVATASLELGIDVGAIDLVCQIGSPRAIATFLQRVGRAGHSVGAIPKGRLFALTRDELLEAMAMVQAVKSGILDKVIIPEQPLDILCQQLVAEATAGEVTEDALFALARCAYPYRDLPRRAFDEVIDMLAAGFAKGRRQLAYLHRDQIHGVVRARKGARITALTSGGAIPEQGDFRVMSEDDGSFVGTVNEDFAIESAKGDIFLLGNTSWQVTCLRGIELVVKDAHGAPPSIPFWLGEAPGRTIELSAELSALREGLDQRIELPPPEDPLFSIDQLAEVRALDPPGYRSARAWLMQHSLVDDWAALQAVHYVAVQKAALGVIPTQKRVVFERFFDDSGGMQLVIHAPFGMRINKGWGLALRKRFCRSFDFELQASADNDGIVLSLGPQHSFPIEQLFRMLNEHNIQGLLEQAILAVPLFQVRWRWNTTRALAVLRNRSGKRVPPALQRFRADDLMTAVFPAQTQCKEHVTGDIEVPDHPLVRQTMYDCLHEAIDIDGLIDLMRRIATGEIELLARDTREPSPFSYQLLNAYPYAFLDGAPLEERRARAVATRRTLGVGDFADLGRLSPDAMAQVEREAWPLVRSPDELHDVLGALGALPELDAQRASDHEIYNAAWTPHMDVLVKAGRAARVTVGNTVLWFAAESLSLITAAYPSGNVTPELTLPDRLRQEWTPEDARLYILRGYLECKGIMTAAQLAGALAIPENHVQASLPAIEARGELVRGHFRTGAVAASSASPAEDGLMEGYPEASERPSRAAACGPIQWCERRLLMRIHRLTLDGLRRQIKPVSAEEFLSYLTRHQRLTGGRRAEGKAGLMDVLQQLQGFDAAAGAWETEILATRVTNYYAGWLDELTHSGLVTWGRLRPPTKDEEDGPVTGGMTRAVPLALFWREDLAWLLPGGNTRAAALGLARANALTVHQSLSAHGAQFFHELKARTGLLETHLEEAIGELTRLGLVNADGYAAIRPFVSRNRKALERTRSQSGLPRRYHAGPTYALGGRWALFPSAAEGSVQVAEELRLTQWAWLLLKRYGVVFRDLLTKETAAPAWSQLVRTYRQLEARGEIRGGRFVAGAFGEQFALTEAVEELRQVRDQGASGEFVVISAADPLNLLGIITPGPRLASSRSCLVLLQDGRHVATRDGTEISFTGAAVNVITATGILADAEATMRHALQLSGQFRNRSAAALSCS